MMERMQDSDGDGNNNNNDDKDLDLIGALPSEIMTNILSRLPVRSVVKCKFVRKEWRHLVLNISKLEPHLAVFSYKSSTFCKLEESPSRVVFNLKDHVPVSSAKGLILMCSGDRENQNLAICNPITREYVSLAPPPPPPPPSPETTICYGFGESRNSGNYKVVRIIQHECWVYTLGTGWWRWIPVGPPLTLYYKMQNNIRCALVDGNLHWLASPGISQLANDVVLCFDLETEVFTTFSTPPRRSSNSPRRLSVIEECLCLCEDPVRHCGPSRETLIWLMRDRGSWTKYFVIKDCDSIFPIQVLEDGDRILLGDGRRSSIFYYSNTTKTCSGRCRSDPYGNFPTTTLIYAPCFVPLKTLLKNMEQEHEDEVQCF